MSNLVKTSLEIENIRKSCLLLAQLMSEIEPMVQAGVTPLAIDKFAYDWILEHNAKPAFLGYGKFPNTLCIGKNDMATHGVPTKEPFKNSDIVTIDSGLVFNGMYSDMARTYFIGNVAPDTIKFVNTVQIALNNAISSAIVGNHVGDISNAIHSTVRPFGYSPLVEFVGHGIGTKLHEEPAIPGAYGRPGEGLELKPGMTLAIETLVNMGSPKVIISKKDGWTTHSVDGSLFALFENTILITESGPEILTQVLDKTV